MWTATVTKTKDAEPMGEYKPTAVDARKAAADFLLINVNPNIIDWKDGRRERVTAKKLKVLQKKYKWATDF